MSFYKPRLEQINGAVEMREQLDKLIASYEARKVITSIPLKRTDESAVDGAVYDANTLLNWLVQRTENLDTIQKTSASLVNARLQKFEDKLVKDSVRIQLSATWAGDHYSVSLPGNFETLVPNVSKDLVYAYYLDNTPVLDADGNAIKFDLNTMTFDGVVSVLDIVTSAKITTTTADRVKIYSPKQESFEFKVFPVGKFTLATLPEDYMLDNEELQTIAYQQAIDRLVVQLTQDDRLIAEIKELIGSEAVKEQIRKEDAALRADIANFQKYDADQRKAIVDDFNSRLVYAPDINVPKTQVFELSEAPTVEFVLDEKPNGSRISMNVNGIVYDEEADAFIIDRDTKTITWIGGPDNGGFDLTTNVARKVIIHYFVDGRLEKDVATEVPPINTPPTSEENEAPSDIPEPVNTPEHSDTPATDAPEAPGTTDVPEEPPVEGE